MLGAIPRQLATAATRLHAFVQDLYHKHSALTSLEPKDSLRKSSGAGCFGLAGGFRFTAGFYKHEDVEND